MHITKHSAYCVYFSLRCDWACKVLLHELKVLRHHWGIPWFTCNMVIPFKKIKIFYITVSPVLKCFCSGILVSYPETAKQPYWMLGKRPTFWQTKELYLHWNPKPPVSSPWVQDCTQVFLSAELWEPWRVRFGRVLGIRADLPSVEWSRHSGLVTLPPSHLSWNQYHMALWVAVKGQSSVSLKGRLELQIGGNIQVTSVPENKTD